MSEALFFLKDPSIVEVLFGRPDPKRCTYCIQKVREIRDGIVLSGFAISFSMTSQLEAAIATIGTVVYLLIESTRSARG